MSKKRSASAAAVNDDDAGVRFVVKFHYDSMCGCSTDGPELIGSFDTAQAAKRALRGDMPSRHYAFKGNAIEEFHSDWSDDGDGDADDDERDYDEEMAEDVRAFFAGERCVA